MQVREVQRQGRLEEPRRREEGLALVPLYVAPFPEVRFREFLLPGVVRSANGLNKGVIVGDRGLQCIQLRSPREVLLVVDKVIPPLL